MLRANDGTERLSCSLASCWRALTANPVSSGRAAGRKLQRAKRVLRQLYAALSRAGAKSQLCTLRGTSFARSPRRPHRSRLRSATLQTSRPHRRLHLPRRRPPNLRRRQRGSPMRTSRRSWASSSTPRAARASRRGGRRARSDAPRGHTKRRAAFFRAQRQARALLNISATFWRIPSRTDERSVPAQATRRGVRAPRARRARRGPKETGRVRAAHAGGRAGTKRRGAFLDALLRAASRPPTPGEAPKTWSGRVPEDPTSNL